MQGLPGCRNDPLSSWMLGSGLLGLIAFDQRIDQDKTDDPQCHKGVNIFKEIHIAKIEHTAEAMRAAGVQLCR